MILILILISRDNLCGTGDPSLICLQYSLFGIITFGLRWRWSWLHGADSQVSDVSHDQSFQAFKLREWKQLRQWLQRPGQHRQQHDPQPRPAGQHPHHHAAPRPDPLRPAAAHTALANQEEQTRPVSSTEDVWTGLWEGNRPRNQNMSQMCLVLSYKGDSLTVWIAI